MRKVTREEVRDRSAYEGIRDTFRRSVMAQKDRRRIHAGPYLTFLFENHDTVLYQIQEMIRAEGIHGEAEILHEVRTYNDLLGARGELGCTLLIEIEDKERRSELLAKWIGLPQSVYLKTMDGRSTPAIVDDAQISDRRISAVQYLKFPVGDGVPVSLGVAHPEFNLEVSLSADQSAALCEDLMQ